MLDQSTRLFHQHLVRAHVCAQCWGELVERVICGEWRVLCPRGCQPGGFITRESADRRRAQDLADFHAALANYPNLDPRQRRSPQRDRAALAILYGKD